MKWKIDPFRIMEWAQSQRLFYYFPIFLNDDSVISRACAKSSGLWAAEINAASN